MNLNNQGKSPQGPQPPIEPRNSGKMLEGPDVEERARILVGHEEELEKIRDDMSYGPEVADQLADAIKKERETLSGLPEGMATYERMKRNREAAEK